MSPAWSMALASFFFASMGVCVKLASDRYGAGEMVFYRSLIGMLTMLALVRRHRGSLRTRVPTMHLGRSASGVAALCLWFVAIGHLPLATAVTLNYMSSVWMALFLLGGAVLRGTSRIDARLTATVLLGFVGVGLMLRPTIEQHQLGYGFIGLVSGLVAATAYLQMAALGDAGEPDYRVVFYFSLSGVAAGAALAWAGGWHRHTWSGAALLLGMGVLATAAQLLMTRAYMNGKTLVNASLQYLAIACSFVYGVALFGDRVTWWALAGMAFIVAAGFGATVLGANAPPAAMRARAI
jgi:drug/metabolite transporter (DMT)-like permease